MPGITDCIRSYSTFTITSQIGREKEIIAAVTFDCDKERENVIIYWLGTDGSTDQESAVPDEFGRSWRQNGFCTLLLRILIKYCMVDNNNGVSIYLQVSSIEYGSISFYNSKGFGMYDNNKSLVPDSLEIKNKNWINEKNMVLMI